MNPKISSGLVFHRKNSKRKRIKNRDDKTIPPKIPLGQFWDIYTSQSFQAIKKSNKNARAS